MKRFTVEDIIDRNENIRLMRYTAIGNKDIHIHEFLEIVYIFSGKGKHCVNSVWYPVQRGNLLFINFGQTHAFYPQGEMEIANCLLSPEIIDSELINCENVNEILAISTFQDFNIGEDRLIPLLQFEGKGMLEMEMLIGNMLSEFERKKANYKTALKGYVLILLTFIFRTMQESATRYISPDGAPHARGSAVYREQLF